MIDKWKKVPEIVNDLEAVKEVIGINKRDDILQGYLTYDVKNKSFYIESENELSQEVTHYIEVSDLLELPKE